MNVVLKIFGMSLMGIFLNNCDFFKEASGNKTNNQPSLRNPESGYVPGQSLPGNWRPFSDDSPWNTPVPSGAKVHFQSQAIIERMSSAAGNIRSGNYYLIPLWVVNSDKMSFYPAKAKYPFDIWDTDNDFVTDVAVPIDTTLWGEQTEDGHVIVLDTLYDFSWEMSRFKGIVDGTIDCSTFNVWDLTGPGTGDPDEGKRWKARGGRGSGFPEIAGLVRPEEILSGEIRHALAFTFSAVKMNDFYYPACRSDGKSDDLMAPAEGMLFQLDPALNDADFDRWGLSQGAKIIARALQKYGMYLCDVGGNMALQLQLLDKDSEEHRKKWDNISPGLYSSVMKIPTSEFRLIDTGVPLSGGAADVVTTPLINPPYGTFKKQVEIKITVNQEWPDAVIRYTLDGTDPTESSVVYTGPFPIKESRMVKAAAFCGRGKPSHVMRASFIIM